MPDLGTILGFTLVGLVFAAVARLYLRDARDRRAGRGDGAFAWRRNPSTIRPAAPKPVLRVLPRRWGRRHVVIATAQVVAIGGLTWLSLGEPWRHGEVVPPKIYPLVLIVWTILVAFATALLTCLWDLSRAALARGGAGTSQGQKAGGECARVLAPRRRLGEGA